MHIYHSLADLRNAYQTGALSARHKVILDNDSVTLYDPDDENAYEPLFDGNHPEVLLREALDLLGIPWENA